jgi:peptidoglycan/xylan/chitin deacetylase (PgdA/CDA1 family)
MNYLSEKNYKVITPKEFYDLLQTGKNPTQKTIMLTFDDGNSNNYTNAYPILKKYGFTGVFYVPSSRRGINNTQLKEMSENGMIIDPHGKTHMLLSKITDPIVLYDELVNSKLSIQSVTGKTSYSFCYPGCEYNGSVTSMLASNGYLLGFTCGKKIDHKIGGRFSISRMHVYDNMEHFINILSGNWYYPTY